MNYSLEANKYIWMGCLHSTLKDTFRIIRWMLQSGGNESQRICPSDVFTDIKCFLTAFRCQVRSYLYWLISPHFPISILFLIFLQRKKVYLFFFLYQHLSHKICLLEHKWHYLIFMDYSIVEIEYHPDSSDIIHAVHWVIRGRVGEDSYPVMELAIGCESSLSGHCGANWEIFMPKCSKL